MGMLQRMSPGALLVVGRCVVQYSTWHTAPGLQHGEHVLQVDVVARQLVTQEGDDVARQSMGARHDEAGQIPRGLGLLGAMQEQRPAGVVGV